MSFFVWITVCLFVPLMCMFFVCTDRLKNVHLWSGLSERMLLSGLNSLWEIWCWIISELYFHHVTAWKMTLACVASSSFIHFSVCCNTLVTKNFLMDFFSLSVFLLWNWNVVNSCSIFSLSLTRARTRTHTRARSPWWQGLVERYHLPRDNLSEAGQKVGRGEPRDIPRYQRGTLPRWRDGRGRQAENRGRGEAKVEVGFVGWGIFRYDGERDGRAIKWQVRLEIIKEGVGALSHRRAQSTLMPVCTEHTLSILPGYIKNYKCRRFKVQ